MTPFATAPLFTFYKYPCLLCDSEKVSMKLAEALRLRKDYITRRSNVGDRIRSNLKVQEDEIPQEEPWQLVKEYEDISRLLLELISRINAVNSVTLLNYASHLDNPGDSSAGEATSNIVPKGLVFTERTLSFALADREILTKTILMYSSMSHSADTSGSFRNTKLEIKIKAVVLLKDIQRRIDKYQKLLRLLDTAIQEKNWTIEIDDVGIVEDGSE